MMLYREALQSDSETITQLLTVSNLPSSDCEQYLKQFSVLEAKDKLIAVGGMEVYNAVEYFIKQGFSIEKRSKDPVAIKKTAQFKTLCPDSAIIMCRAV